MPLSVATVELMLLAKPVTTTGALARLMREIVPALAEGRAPVWSELAAEGGDQLTTRLVVAQRQDDLADRVLPGRRQAFEEIAASGAAHKGNK